MRLKVSGRHSNYRCFGSGALILAALTERCGNDRSGWGRLLNLIAAAALRVNDGGFLRGLRWQHHKHSIIADTRSYPSANG
jgi:hypothetical protein